MKLILCLACLLSLSGCAIATSSRTPGATYSATSPAAVEILYQSPARPFVVVGFVTVAQTITPETASKTADVANKWREGAAAVGAQAVIVDSMPTNSFITPKAGSGRAIRWL